MILRDDLIDPSDLAVYRQLFHIFARVEAPDLASPMYAELCYGIALDDELLALASQKRRGQPAPNVMLAAVQYLLLSGPPWSDHPLAAHYPIVSGEERPLDPAFPLFRDFALSYGDDVLAQVRTRGTQTNVVRRCACLLPSFSMAARESGRALALIDLGASGGINLNFDRYRYRYERGGVEESRWGSESARVRLESELRGAGAMPSLADAFDVVSRVGVDLNPIDLGDADQVRWLRALIWPEHLERHQRLIDAAEELQSSPVELHQGDGAELLPSLIEDAPSDAALVVYSTVALYQFGAEGRARVMRALEEAGRERPIWFVTMENRPTQLTLTRYRGGSGARQHLAEVSPHGWWMSWADSPG